MKRLMKVFSYGHMDIYSIWTGEKLYGEECVELGGRPRKKWSDSLNGCLRKIFGCCASKENGDDRNKCQGFVR